MDGELVFPYPYFVGLHFKSGVQHMQEILGQFESASGSHLEANMNPWSTPKVSSFSAPTFLGAMGWLPMRAIDGSR